HVHRRCEWSRLQPGQPTRVDRLAGLAAAVTDCGSRHCDLRLPGGCDLRVPGDARPAPERVSYSAIACARRFTSLPWLVRRALIGVLPGSVSSVVNSHRNISVEVKPESASTVIVPPSPLTMPLRVRNWAGTVKSSPRRKAINWRSR